MPLARCCRHADRLAYASIEILVVEPAPSSRRDDYNRFMRDLYAKVPNQWVRLPFCPSCFQEVIEKFETEIEDDRLWAPGKDHPKSYLAEPKVSA